MHMRAVGTVLVLDIVAGKKKFHNRKRQRKDREQYEIKNGKRVNKGKGCYES